MNNITIKPSRCVMFGYVLVSVLQTACADERASLVVRYLPLDIETYLAVTPKNIAESTVCVYSGLPIDVEDNIHALIDRAEIGQFDAARVRIKLEGFRGGNVYIDASGGIYDDSINTYRKLAPSDFKMFRDIFLVIERRDCLFGVREWPTDRQVTGK